jgi:hypothetical protein
MKMDIEPTVITMAMTENKLLKIQIIKKWNKLLIIHFESK